MSSYRCECCGASFQKIYQIQGHLRTNQCRIRQQLITFAQSNGFTPKHINRNSLTQLSQTSSLFSSHGTGCQRIRASYKANT